jgi:hypothetical protein
MSDYEPMLITKKRINNHLVTAIPIKVDKRPVLGADICSEVYNNICLFAPTKSGKTTVEAHMLEHCAGKKTKIYAFVSTIDNDPNWVAIKKTMMKKGIDFEGYNSIFVDGTNKLQEILNELAEEAREREEEEEAEEPHDVMDDLAVYHGVKHYIKNKPKKKKKEKKSKFQYPDIILLFDDLSDELKHPSYTALLKKARNYRIKTLTASQYVHDISPGALYQMRLFIIFAGQAEDKLLNIFNKMALKMPFEQFKAIYKDATTPTKDTPKPFLYVAPHLEDIRQNFRTKYNIEPTKLHHVEKSAVKVPKEVDNDDSDGDQSA